LVISMADVSPQGDETHHQYWVESAVKKGIVFSSQSEENQDVSQLSKEELKKKQKQTGFQLDRRILKDPVVLPGEIEFQDVEIAGEEEPLTTDKVYIYYRPQGLVDESVIHLRLVDDNETQWTVAINPLTGDADVVGRYMSLKDIQEQ